MLMQWPFTKRLLFGPAPLRFQPGALHRFRQARASTWVNSLAVNLTGKAGDAVIRLARWLSRKPVEAEVQLEAADDGQLRRHILWEATHVLEAPTPEADESRAALLRKAIKHDRHSAMYERVGYWMIAICWVIGYFILVYGKLVYDLLGPSVNHHFARTWGLGMGMNQVQDEARTVAITIAETTAVALLLEALWLIPNSGWLETVYDDASIAATLMGRSCVTVGQRIRNEAHFRKALA